MVFCDGTGKDGNSGKRKIVQSEVNQLLQALVQKNARMYGSSVSSYYLQLALQSNLGSRTRSKG